MKDTKFYRIKNEAGREVIVPERLVERNKEKWEVLEEWRDKDNNLDTTVVAAPVKKAPAKKVKLSKEEIDIPDDIDADLSKMGIQALRDKCKEIGIKQPFGASKEDLRELLKYNA